MVVCFFFFFFFFHDRCACKQITHQEHSSLLRKTFQHLGPHFTKCKELREACTMLSSTLPCEFPWGYFSLRDHHRNGVRCWPKHGYAAHDHSEGKVLTYTVVQCFSRTPKRVDTTTMQSYCKYSKICVAYMTDGMLCSDRTTLVPVYQLASVCLAHYKPQAFLQQNTEEGQISNSPLFLSRHASNCVFLTQVLSLSHFV